MRSETRNADLPDLVASYLHSISHLNKGLYTRQRYDELIWREGKRFSRTNQQILHLLQHIHK
jgi:hypothetical protein